MKVVLFCGGLGTRLGDLTENIPKPLVKIGYRPILWHVMKYYAHFGHKDFILCLGYRADDIIQCFSPDGKRPDSHETLPHACRSLELFEHDIREWNITFADTGLHSNIGQ